MKATVIPVFGLSVQCDAEVDELGRPLISVPVGKDVAGPGGAIMINGKRHKIIRIYSCDRYALTYEVEGTL